MTNFNRNSFKLTPIEKVDWLQQRIKSQQSFDYAKDVINYIMSLKQKIQELETVIEYLR